MRTKHLFAGLLSLPKIWYGQRTYPPLGHEPTDGQVPLVRSRGYVTAVSSNRSVCITTLISLEMQFSGCRGSLMRECDNQIAWFVYIVLVLKFPFET